MITPEFLDDVVRGTEEAVSSLDEALVQKIAKRIQAGYQFYGEVKFIPSTIHDLQKIMASGLTIQEVEEVITKALPGLEEEVSNAFQVSAVDISNTNSAMMRQAIQVLNQNGETITSATPKTDLEGIPSSVKDLNLTAPEVRQLEAAYRRTNGTVRNLTKTTATAANQAYIKACDDAYMKIQAGVSPNDAIIDAIREMGKRGITTVDYASGRTDKIEVAIARAVRTGINQANAEISLTRAAEMGVKHVRVSAHLGARVTKQHDFTNHAEWQGKVYELDYSKPELARFSLYATEGQEQFTGLKAVAERIKKWWNDRFNKKGREYDDFVDTCGYGKMLGICGINCRHTFTAFIPGINEVPSESIDKEENEKRYRETQKQRAMERKMRELKREIAALEPLKESEEARNQKRALKQSYLALDAEYQQFNKEHGLKGQNWRREIPKIPSR